jgi:hypothetical protein
MLLSFLKACPDFSHIKPGISEYIYIFKTPKQKGKQDSQIGNCFKLQINY